MRYQLRTLLILLTIRPPVLAWVVILVLNLIPVCLWISLSGFSIHDLLWLAMAVELSAGWLVERSRGTECKYRIEATGRVRTNRRPE